MINTRMFPYQEKGSNVQGVASLTSDLAVTVIQFNARTDQERVNIIAGLQYLIRQILGDVGDSVMIQKVLDGIPASVIPHRGETELYKMYQKLKAVYETYPAIKVFWGNEYNNWIRDNNSSNYTKHGKEFSGDCVIVCDDYFNTHFHNDKYTHIRGFFHIQEIEGEIYYTWADDDEKTVKGFDNILLTIIKNHLP